MSDGEGVEDNVDGLLALSTTVEVSIDEGAVEVLMMLLVIVVLVELNKQFLPLKVLLSHRRYWQLVRAGLSLPPVVEDASVDIIEDVSLPEQIPNPAMLRTIIPNYRV